MTAQVMRLYPPPAAGQPAGVQPLPGLYLQHRLHELGAPEQPFIYGNFVASLDGRIALADSADGPAYVPQSLTTGSDWLLFQELQAQADCFIVHGGYLRALAAGRLDNILHFNPGPESAYLTDWRRQQGLPEQPTVIALSASLNFSLPPSVRAQRQRFYIVTPEGTDRTRVKLWRDKGYEVVIAGSGRLVGGAALLDVLQQLGVRSVYLQAGPQMLSALLREGLLGRLYLTLSHQILGGEHFHSLMTGPTLAEAGRLNLHSLYFDAQSDKNTGQFFACFEPQPSQ